MGGKDSTVMNMSAWKGSEPADFAFIQFIDCTEPLDGKDKHYGECA